MKDSGIEWIDKIPKEWEIIRVKDKYYFNTGFTPDTKNPEYYNDEDGYEWVTISDINNGKINSPTISLISRDYVKNNFCKQVPKGCLLYSFKLSIGQTAITDRPLFTNEALASFIPSPNTNIRFLNYSSSLIEFNANTNIYGAKILNQQLINNAYIVFPPLNEQKQIADFLDRKCSEIDVLRLEIEKEIATLKEYKKSIITETVTKGLNKNVPMKDSGYGYLTFVPKHWEIDKFKYHFKRQTIKNHPDSEVLSLYREFGIIPKSSRNDNHNVTSEDTSKYLYVQTGNLVINKMKAWQGSVAVSNYTGIVSPAYFVYDFKNNNFCKRYFHYLLRNKQYTVEFRRLSGGIREGQWDLPAEELENVRILIPPQNEQKQIADYLDRKCSKIDDIIEAKNKQISTLDGYKKSLIYEYVTGKKEVPGV